MSSLWTPGGEHRVADEDPLSDGAADSPAPSQAEVDAQREFAELERELVSTPVGDVVANHCYGLFQLGALHLSQSPPNLTDARVAIDALSAIIEALGERLGASYQTLLDGLTQIRLAYVQIAGAPEVGEESKENESKGEATPS